MAQPAAVLSILVKANTGQATTGLLRINQQLEQTEKHSHKVARAIEGVAKAGALIGGAAIVGGFAYATKKAADFEQQMSSLGAVTDASGRQMERFRKQAMKAGADTKFSALEAAQAQTELAKGGLTVKQIMRGGLKSALALAAAGEMDLADAATATVNAIKLFNLRGRDAMKVADGFATAANRTTADVSDFVLAMQQGGSAAKNAGLSFQETTAWLETLAEAGIKGSDAGTSLKTALVQLASPSSAKAKETAKKLGIEVFNAQGKMKSLVGVAKELEDGFKGLTQKQKIQAATTLVGQDGFRALLALYDAGPKKVGKFERELGKQGAAQDVARKKQDNLKGSLENLRGSVETFAIQIGEKMIPAIRDGADHLKRFVDDVGRIFARDDLSLGEKLNRAFELMKVRAKPWLDKLKVEIDHANIPEKLAAVISAATPVIAKAAAQAGIASAKTFAGAFAQSNVWGKLVLGGWLLSRMGGKAGFFKMGATAGTSFGEGMAATAAGGLGGKLRGALGGLASLGKKLLVLDVAVNLVDQHGNPIAAAINTAHDITFGIVPKVKNLSGNERAEASIKGVADQLDRAFKGRNLGNIEKVRDKIKGMADEARAFGRQDLAKQLDELADQGSQKLNKLSDAQHKVSGMSDRFAAAIKGLRLKGTKDFRGLVDQVTFGSKQILKTGGEKSEQTQQAISKQFRLARKRVKQAMDDSVLTTKQGLGLLHTLAVKELALYGIKAGRVNVVLARGANGQMRPTQRGGFMTGGKPTGDSIPVLAERGEYVLNRKAVEKVGKRKLDNLNFGMVPRFQRGGTVGGLQAGISSAANQVLAHFPGLAITSTTGGGHAKGSYHYRGMAVDIAGAAEVMNRAAAWIKSTMGPSLTEGIHNPNLSIKNGQSVPPSFWGATTWAGHANHIHLAIAGALNMLAQFAGLKRPVLKGPSSVALEAGQGAIDRVGSAANAAVMRAISSVNVGAESGSGIGRGSFGKAALKRLWVQAGGPPGIANLMAAVALAESGGNPKAHNPSGASGLWQILGVPFPGNVYDPLTNARMAVSKYRSQGLGAWEAYTNGNYSQYLQRGGMVGMQRGGLPRALGKTLQHVRNRRSPHLRSSAVSKFLKQARKAGLPIGLQRNLKKFSTDADTYADYADRASALTGDTGGNPKIRGKTQAEWLQAELEALFRWRNALIRAEKIIAKRRKEIAKTLAGARKIVHASNVQLRDLKKHPKRNKKLIRQLTHQRDALKDRIIPGLVDKGSNLTSTRGDLLSNLQDVQGLGSPMRVLKRLPAVGVLGGRIFDTQMQLRDLSASPAPDVQDTSDTGDSDRSDLLSQLLREANLRTAVSEAQFKVFQNMPQFATGGIVPGPNGAAVPAVVHAGEGVFTRDQMAAMGGGSNVTINVAPGMEWLERFITVTVDKNTRADARRAGRRLAGRGGGIT